MTTDNKQDWSIDHTAGRPILVYQNCSVIEAEQAEYVLRLIEADKLRGTSEPHPVAWITTVQVAGGPEDPPEYDTVCVPGDSPPNDRNKWAPLYTVPQASAEARNAALEEAAQKAAALEGEAAESYEATKEPYFEGKSDAYSHAENVILALKSGPTAEPGIRNSQITAEAPVKGAGYSEDGICWSSKEIQRRQREEDEARASFIADRQQRGGDVDERAAFEAWAKTQPDSWLIVGGLTWSPGTNDYASARTNAAWAAWQARTALAEKNQSPGIPGYRTDNNAMVRPESFIKMMELWGKAMEELDSVIYENEKVDKVLSPRQLEAAIRSVAGSIGPICTLKMNEAIAQQGKEGQP